MPGMSTMPSRPVPIMKSHGLAFCQSQIGTRKSATATTSPIAMKPAWRTRK